MNSLKRLFRVFTFSLLTLLLIPVFLLGILYAGMKFRESSDRRELAPSAGKFISTKDVEIFIQEAGKKDAPVVVLIHGMGSWSELWRDTLNSLGENGYHAIAIDLPPFGFSERPTDVNRLTTLDQGKRIWEVLDSLGIQKATLVGHSFGGGPTLHAALISPERLNSLILVDIAANTKEGEFTPIPDSLFGLLNRKFLRDILFSASITNPALTKTLFGLFVNDPSCITKEKLDMIQKPMAIENSTRYLGDWITVFLSKEDSILAKDFAHKSNRLTMPKFLIWGYLDTVTPISRGEELHRLLPGSNLLIMKEAGHIPQLENPKEFNRILLDSLNAKR